jgi:hypothetical protein
MILRASNHPTPLFADCHRRISKRRWSGFCGTWQRKGRIIAKTDGYKQSRKDRKRVEMLFAHRKSILKPGSLAPSGTEPCAG